MPRKTRGKVSLSGERRTDLERATRLLTLYALLHGSTARPAHSRRLERGHLGQDARRGIEHRQRQHRSRSFAEAKAEVENRIETQGPERGPMPRFRRAMACEQIATSRRRDRHGDEGRRAGDETIENDGHSFRDRKSVV